MKGKQRRGFVTRHKISLLMEFLYFWPRSFSRLHYKRRGHPETANGLSLRSNCFLVLGLPTPLNVVHSIYNVFLQRGANCRLQQTLVFRSSKEKAMPTRRHLLRCPCRRPINLLQRDFGSGAIESKPRQGNFHIYYVHMILAVLALSLSLSLCKI